MAGLSAGIRLAMYDKKVLILVRHYVAGGLNSYYHKDRRRFDVGLHDTESDEVQGSNRPDLDPLDLDQAIEFPHRSLIEGTGEAREGGGDRRMLAQGFTVDEGSRLVRWKYTAVILEDHKIVDQDQAVGRVHIEHIDFRIAGGGVLQVLLHGEQAPGFVSVDTAQTGQAVLALLELEPESRRESFGSRGKITDRDQIPLFCDFPSNRHLVGILKSERRQPGEIVAHREFAPHRDEHFRGGAPDFFTENRGQPRARVFRIEMDLSGLQCAETYRRPREVEPARHLEVAAGLESLGKDLGQEPTFGMG